MIEFTQLVLASVHYRVVFTTSTFLLDKLVYRFPHSVRAVSTAFSHLLSFGLVSCQPTPSWVGSRVGSRCRLVHRVRRVLLAIVRRFLLAIVRRFRRVFLLRGVRSFRFVSIILVLIL